MRFALIPWVLITWVIAPAYSADAPAQPSAAGRSAGNAIAVLEFELSDLTLDPNNAAERERTASIRPMLQTALVARDFSAVAVDSAAQSAADQGVGYLFDHPDVAASLGKSVGADWIVVGRVHKSSFLFAYLKVHVVNTHTAAQVADLVVEVKGPQQTLTQRGVETLAQQIAETTKSADARR